MWNISAWKYGFLSYLGIISQYVFFEKKKVDDVLKDLTLIILACLDVLDIASNCAHSVRG